MEIELRAKILNQKLFEQKLRQLEEITEKLENERQVDIYLKHEKDENRKMIIRIRKNYEDDSAILTFKGSSNKNYGDIAWEDFDVPIKNPDRLERILVDNGYLYVCLIDKVRQSFSHKEFEINVDNIRDLGLFVEIEKRGEERDIKKVKKEILEIFENLGITQENIIKKGYVQLAIETEDKQ